MNATLQGFKERLGNLNIELRELPEEHLFYSLPNPRDWELRWPILRSERRIPIDILGRIDARPIHRIVLLEK
jgi:hypothetical protein